MPHPPALRLSRYFGTSPDFWMNLQSAYELDSAREEIGKAIERIPQRSDSVPEHGTGGSERKWEVWVGLGLK